MTERQVNILVALPAEAKPIIRTYGLQRKQPDGIYPCYVKQPFTLVLTGPGTEAMEKSVAFLHSQQQEDNSAIWLNIGITGHGSLARGTCLLAECVHDLPSACYWQLSPPVDHLFPAGPLHCVAEPVSIYKQDTAYDMESSGFAAGIDKIGALERAQIMKVVSDNPQEPSSQINGRMVSDLIQSAIPTLSVLIDRLKSHA
ncbi:MAG: hypothetical protein KZQ75_02900 [Candidatus Thiodiazotropha sp. (ex Myrtea spinifera)]|nr:hypothetical protein [Candidatus Thiodiazotropha sp. (ex Myrtea spinifera)]MCU7829339.1 hypothetical protein [Candidatus Thiodiazotropha sp. (ex Myrtea sp. 'scaly one' KF741663)]